MSWNAVLKCFVIKLDEVIVEGKDYVDLVKTNIGYSLPDTSGETKRKSSNWYKQLSYKLLEVDANTMRPQVAIMLNEDLLWDEDYLRHEVKSLGRLFIRNFGNSNRHLILNFGAEENKLIIEGNILKITLSKKYQRPTFLEFFEETAVKIMKKNKIIEGIASQLWHRYKLTSYRETEDKAFLQLAYKVF